MSTTVRRRVLAAATTLYVSATAWAAGPEPWDYWLPSNPNGAAVNHSPWQGFLDRYLVELPDGSTRVRYDAVTAADRKALDDYLETLSTLDPRQLSRDTQLAFWINLYNAQTVRVVLDNPGKNSILRMGGGLLHFSGPWKKKYLAIAGQPISLDDIEHRILRPIWQDPRIHFAVNCASIGCPNLAPTAFTADNAEALMAAGKASYLNHPRGLHFDDDGTLVLSSIFEWYRVDFGGSRDALLDYLAEARPDLAGRLRNYSGPIDYEYDWSLNAAD